MPRLKPLTVEDAPEETKAALSRKGVTTPTRIYAYWPPLIGGVDGMQRALESDRRLPETLIRLAKLRTAQLSGCPF